MAPGQLLTMRELIAECGRKVGAERRCSNCDRYTLYGLHYPDGTVALVCSTCDTGEQ